MKLLLEYFGLVIFAFVVLVGGLILLPRVTTMPQTSPSEMVGLALAFVVIGGGFSWYYLAASHQGTAGPPPER
jgi:drug/metabolite transporter (DMT)-like permease